MLIAEVEAIGAGSETTPPLKTTGDKMWSIIYGRILGNDGRPIVCMEVSAGLVGSPYRSYKTTTNREGIYILPIPYPAGTEVDVAFDGKGSDILKTRGDFPGPDGLQTINRTPSFPVGNILATAFCISLLAAASYGVYRLIRG